MKKKLTSLLLALVMLLMVFSPFALAHPGRTDSLGGHYVRKSGWGYKVGTYHYHKGPYAGHTVSYKGQVPKAHQKK